MEKISLNLNIIIFLAKIRISNVNFLMLLFNVTVTFMSHFEFGGLLFEVSKFNLQISDEE